MPLELPRRRELAELVPDHIFLNEYFQEFIAVMHFERMANKFRDDRAGACPGFNGLLGAALIERVHLAEKFFVDEWTFFCASAHKLVASC